MAYRISGINHKFTFMKLSCFTLIHGIHNTGYGSTITGTNKHVSRVPIYNFFSTECNEKTSEAEGLNLSFVV